MVFGVLALVLALRIMHLSSALQSPLSFHPGPDEDYYRRFGTALAAGHGADAAEFTFMDPGYGYLLGAVFTVVGVNPVAVFLLQALLDTATSYGILWIGRRLDRPRAGLFGAILYGVTSTAIMFCAALLKETCVACFTTFWVAAALAVSRSQRRWAWLAFGAFCGLGIALRSTLALLGVAALLLSVCGRPRRLAALARPACLLAGLAVALLPWSVRNERAFGSLSPLPHNGGIVLHQAYNADNPGSSIWIPPFVNYLDPGEIWRGYAAEAERRIGHPLSPRAVDGFWRGEALGFMRTHAGAVLEAAARKGLLFLAATEIPNNRSSAEERLFSPVLAALPPPMAWLLAMGLAGLAWLAMRDRRWPIVAAPVAVAWLTMAAFWAEDRFRFHTAPVLALSSGIWLDAMLARRGTLRQRPPARVLAVAGLAVVLCASSWALGRSHPPPPVRWDHIIWGYIKMGRRAEAQALAARVIAEQPDDAPVMEALGYLAAVDGRYSEAVDDYRRAVALRPRSYLAHYNLSKAWLALGRRNEAAAEAAEAMRLDPPPANHALVEQTRGDESR